MALKLHLDTNAYTAFLRGQKEVVFLVERAPTLALSPIVIGELKAGFALGSRTRDNLRTLERFLDSPRVTVPALDGRVTDRYARLYRDLRNAGTPIPTNDLWIAACVSDDGDALSSFDRHLEAVHGLELVRDEEELRRWLD